MEDFTDQIKKWLNGEKIIPTWVQLQPTSLCNLNCLFCARRKYIKDRLSDEKWLQLTKEVCDMKVKRITITGGGEPLLRKKLFIEMIKEIKDNSIEGDIVTNGSLIDNRMAREIVSSGWDFISFSIHGSNAETHDYLSGGKSFDKILKGINLINDWKNQLRTEKPTMVFHVILTSMNYNQIEDMVKLIHENGVREIKLALLMIDRDENLKHLKLSEPQLEPFYANYKKASKLADSLNMTLRSEFTRDEILSYIDSDYNKEIFCKKTENPVTSENTRVRCLIPFNEMVIFPDGIVSVCCSIHEKYEENSDNNIVDSVLNKTLSEVWDGKVFNEFRRAMVENRPPRVCSQCPPTLIYQRSSEALFRK